MICMGGLLVAQVVEGWGDYETGWWRVCRPLQPVPTMHVGTVQRKNHAVLISVMLDKMAVGTKDNALGYFFKNAFF